MKDERPPDPAVAAPPTPPLLNIAAVERDTRIGKDTLRVWERRYGFPQPERDGNGERLYPFEQIERLRIIKRLLDAGHRPGRIVGLGLDELQQLGQSLPETSTALSLGADTPEPESDAARLLQILRSQDPAHLRRAMTRTLLRAGLDRFVLEVAIPLLQEIGHAWARGDMAIYEEHLCSEMLETTLRAALASSPVPPPGSRPRVLLTTLPGEQHSLGLLMAEILFSVEGCICINLGSQTPLPELLRATQAFHIDIVAISGSAASHANHVADTLNELRAMLPDSLAIWAGTPHPSLQRRAIPGVLLVESLASLGQHVHDWQRVHGVEG